MIIQVALVFMFLGGLAYVFVLSKGGRAERKVGLIALVGVAICCVLFPDLTNGIAHLVGVGRGADLVEYMFIPITGFTCINLYIREKHLEHRIHILTVELAMQAHTIQRLTRQQASER